MLLNFRKTSMIMYYHQTLEIAVHLFSCMYFMHKRSTCMKKEWTSISSVSHQNKTPKYLILSKMKQIKKEMAFYNQIYGS